VKNYKSLAQFRIKQAKFSNRSNSRPVIPKAVRDKVLNRFNGLCGYCGCKPVKLSVDHIIPFVKLPDDSEDNLMPCCFACNSFKSVFNLEQFREELSKQVERARKYSVNFRMGEKFGLIVERKKKIKFYFEIMEELGNEKNN
jgi:hypothetical protein